MAFLPGVPVGGPPKRLDEADKVSSFSAAEHIGGSQTLAARIRKASVSPNASIACRSQISMSIAIVRHTRFCEVVFCRSLVNLVSSLPP